MSSPIDKLPTKIRGLLQTSTDSTTLVFRDDLPLPANPDFSSGHHLIKVRATSPCAGELLWARNFPFTLSEGKSLVPCYDLSGTVVAAPKDSRFVAGTDVWTRTTALHTGNAREYTIATTEELAVKPQGLSWEEAAAVPLSGLTAFQALFEKGGLGLGWRDEKARLENSEKRVLITAGAGGVGSAALQLARAAGVGEIVAMCGTGNVNFVRNLGATEVIDYRKQTLGSWVDAGGIGADIVFDLLGGKVLQDSWKAVKDGGVLIVIKDAIDEAKRPADKQHVKAEFFIMESKGSQLEEISWLVKKGDFKPVIDSVWSLDDYEKAFEIVDGGHAKGKVIIKID